LPDLYDRLVYSDPDPRVVDVPPCIVCDETRARTTYRVEGVDAPIVVCPGCGLGHYHPMPDEAEVASFYPADYYGEPGRKFRPFIEKLVRVVGKRHVLFLSRGLSGGARVLDIGCGRGVLLGPLIDLGFEAHGLELTEEAVRGVDPRAEIRIAGHLRDARYPDAFFDEIILWHVLEHLSDPRGTLEECCRVMKPGGRIIVSLPNFGSLQSRASGAAWFHLDPPRHLFHFPVEALRRLLDRCGFDCESVHHFSLRQNPFGWIQSALNRFSRLPRNALYSYLYQTDPSRRPQLDRASRLGMWSFFVASTPLALALSVVMAAARDGATVHIVARRKS
jgi:SAM-dependent methyltransferase